MKHVIFSIVAWFFAAFSYKAAGQQNNDKKSSQTETREIIIRKKGEKDAKVTIEFKNDEVMVNGKPLIEFKADSITIHNKKVIIKNGDGFAFRDFDFDFDVDNMMNVKSRAFLGVSTESQQGGGVIIKSLVKGEAAEKAGLKENDVITQLDGKKINTPQELFEAVSSKKPGDEVKVNYQRDKKNRNLTVKLGEKKDRTMSWSMRTPEGGRTFVIPRAPQAPGIPGAPRLFEDQWHYEFDNMFGSPRNQKLGIKIQDTEDNKGVKVLEVEEGSAGEKAGIKTDDVITEIDGKSINNTDEAREILKSSKDKQAYTIKAKRGAGTMTFDVKIPRKLKTTTL